MSHSAWRGARFSRLALVPAGENPPDRSQLDRQRARASNQPSEGLQNVYNTGHQDRQEGSRQGHEALEDHAEGDHRFAPQLHQAGQPFARGHPLDRLQGDEAHDLEGRSHRADARKRAPLGSGSMSRRRAAARPTRATASAPMATETTAGQAP
jgi:hypothetical protein